MRPRVLLSVLVLFSALAACGERRPAPVPSPSPVVAPAPAPPPPPACPDDADGVRIEPAQLVTPPVTFDLYQGTIAPESLPVVDAVARRLVACPHVQLEIQVHTDTVRAGSFNLRGSQRVAEAIRDRLVAQGAPASRLAACGYGESQPLSRQPSWDMRSPNARVVWRRIAVPMAQFACPAITAE